MSAIKSVLARRSTIWTLGVVGVLLATLFIVMAPMVRHGYPHTHSLHFNMMWAFQFSQQWFAGQLYPRWLEGSYFGLGNPTFVFYPPLCMWAIIPFAAWGLSTSQTLTGSMVLATLVRGVGSYWAGRCLGSSVTALTVGVAAMITPYFIINVYERGAIGEVWAMSLMPWVMGASWRLTVQEDPQRYRFAWVSLVLAYAGLGLTHLPSLLIWTLIWLLWPLAYARSWIHLKALMIRLYSAAAVGLASVSLYLLPAALDQKWVNIEAINAWDIYDPLKRFMVNVDLFSVQITQDPYDHTLLPYFWIPLGIVVVSLIVLRVQSPVSAYDAHPRLPVWRTLGLLASCTLFATMMMTSLATPLYTASQTLTRIQFPWRWMAITHTVLPFCIGYTTLGLQTLKCQSLRMVTILITLGLLGLCGSFTPHLIDTALYNARLMTQFDTAMAQRPPFPAEPTVDPDQAQHFLGWHWLYPDGLVFIDAFEYRPLTASGNPLPPLQTYDLATWVQGSGTLEQINWRYGSRQLSVVADEPSTLALRTFAYPGWSVRMDGSPVMPMDPMLDGRLQLAVPPGSHDFHIDYQGTTTEQVGGWISLGVWILGIGGLIGSGWRQD